ncbi:hypothetical protein F6R98_10515 [Candidatus Methylospira mobilis]|uniref:Uncharacterized protein n=1 Tax=Candidatus Methylospira mobilis TaxID=1808979 RepID=A0A5Q0BLA7_9GAMM|nr:hypothetical protein [Candidatus Methylospira mobilis]QFY42994.1 hypothetical protein F6R98_10515 [Candidatus Methylospira mobilis]
MSHDNTIKNYMKFLWGPHLAEIVFESPSRQAVSSSVQNASVISGFSIAAIAIILATTPLTSPLLITLVYLFLALMLLFKCGDCLTNSLHFDDPITNQKELKFYRRQVYWGWRHYNLAIIIIIASIAFFSIIKIQDQNIPSHLKLSLYTAITLVFAWWASFWFVDLWKTIIFIVKCEDKNYSNYSTEQKKLIERNILFKLILYSGITVTLTILLTLLPFGFFSSCVDVQALLITLILFAVLRAIVIDTF